MIFRMQTTSSSVSDKLTDSLKKATSIIKSLSRQKLAAIECESDSLPESPDITGINELPQLVGYGVDADDASSATTTNSQMIAIGCEQAESAPLSAEAKRCALATSPVSCSPFEFVTRHDASGHMTFVDERVTALLGYKSSEMLGKSLQEFAANDEQAALVVEQLRYVVDNNQVQPPVSFTWLANGASTSFAATPRGEIVLKCKTSAYAFLRPCNDSFEFVVCTHTFNDLKTLEIRIVS